jgi:UDP-N-acetylglucosamine 4,6-dehydratase
MTQNVAVTLHEMMISSDDARNTVDLGDRYAIEPDFVEYPRTSFRKDGSPPAPEGFVYSSDINDDWLDEAGLNQMLEA